MRLVLLYTTLLYYAIAKSEKGKKALDIDNKYNLHYNPFIEDQESPPSSINSASRSRAKTSSSYRSTTVRLFQEYEEE